LSWLHAMLRHGSVCRARFPEGQWQERCMESTRSLSLILFGILRRLSMMCLEAAGMGMPALQFHGLLGAGAGRKL